MMQTGIRQMMEYARKAHDLMHENEFYISAEEFCEISGFVILNETAPVISINKPQTRKGTWVHRVEWQELKFITVSTAPIKHIMLPEATK